MPEGVEDCRIDGGLACPSMAPTTFVPGPSSITWATAGAASSFMTKRFRPRASLSKTAMIWPESKRSQRTCGLRRGTDSSISPAWS